MTVEPWRHVLQDSQCTILEHLPHLLHYHKDLRKPDLYKGNNIYKRNDVTKSMVGGCRQGMCLLVQSTCIIHCLALAAHYCDPLFRHTTCLLGIPLPPVVMEGAATIIPSSFTGLPTSYLPRKTRRKKERVYQRQHS